MVATLRDLVFLVPFHVFHVHLVLSLNMVGRDLFVYVNDISFYGTRSTYKNLTCWVFYEQNCVQMLQKLASKSSLYSRILVQHNKRFTFI